MAALADAPSPSPYAPGIISDERLPARPAGRAVPFLVAAFAMTTLADGLWQLKITSGDAAKFYSRIIGRADLIPGIRQLAGLPILLWAYLSDRVSLWGTRREGYLTLAIVTIAVAWLIVAAAGQPLVWVAIAALLGLATSFGRVAIYGAIAEIGRRRAATGLLAGAYLILSGLGGLAVVPVLAPILYLSMSIWISAGIAAGLALAVVVLVTIMSGDHVATTASAPEPTLGIPRFLRSRVFWGALALFTCSDLATVPELLVRAAHGDANGTSMRFSPHPAITCGVALAYLGICRRLSVGPLLRAVLLVKAGTFAALALTAGGTSAATLDLLLIVNATGEALTLIALLDIALRAAPRGREAFGVVLLTGLPNLLTSFPLSLAVARSASPLPGIAWFVTGAAIVAAIAVGLLPREIRQGRDGRMIGSAP
jgi:MFS family permease